MDSKYEDPKNWLRCNLCFCLMCKSKNLFSLTSCGHIFCSKCIQRATEECPQCKTQNVPSIILQEPLKSKIKHCFESTAELTEKLRQATLFHDMQRTLNFKRLNEIEKKYAHAKREYHRKLRKIQFLKEKYAHLLTADGSLYEQFQKLELKKTKRSYQNSFLMTPISKVSSIPSSAQSLSCSRSTRTPGLSMSSPQDLQETNSKRYKNSQICWNLHKVFKCQFFERNSRYKLHSQLQLNLNYKSTHFSC